MRGKSVPGARPRQGAEMNNERRWSMTENRCNTTGIPTCHPVRIQIYSLQNPSSRTTGSAATPGAPASPVSIIIAVIPTAGSRTAKRAISTYRIPGSFIRSWNVTINYLVNVREKTRERGRIPGIFFTRCVQVFWIDWMEWPGITGPVSLTRTYGCKTDLPAGIPCRQTLYRELTRWWDHSLVPS